MPAIDPSSAARGAISVTASPKNDSTNLSTPITTSDAAPSCQVAIAAASSSMPPCLHATNAGPSPRQAQRSDEGREGKEGVRQRRFRWMQSHEKQQIKKS